MKKTLFLAAILSLSNAIAFAADDEYDAFRPQVIINVDGTETLKTSEMSPSVNLTQLNTGVKTSERTAIVKEGQGTLILDENVTMHSPLVVREGTMLIGGDAANKVTVYDYPNLESPVFTVGGIKAELVLDNAELIHEAGIKISEINGESFTTQVYSGGKWVDSNSYTTSYVAAICVGGRDGDGVLTLKNNSVLANGQSLFAGTVSYPQLPTKATDYTGTGSHICGSYVSADPNDTTLFREKSLTNGGFAGDVNETRAISTATINIESGSELKLGTGFSVGNTTINIDNATLSTGNRAENSDFTKLGFVGTRNPTVGDADTYLSKTIVNITNGGCFQDNNNGYSSAWGANVGLKIDESGNSYNEINISGGSAWESKGFMQIAFSTSASGTDIINISDKSHMSIGEYAYLGYAGSMVNVTVEKDSSFEVKGNTLQMGKNSSVNVDETSSLTSATKISMMGGASIVNNGTVTVSAANGFIYVQKGATVENHGSINAAETDVCGLLTGDGTMGLTFVYDGGKLVVGNSPGKQTYKSHLMVEDTGSVEFAIDALQEYKPASSEVSGWGSGTHSVIDMQGNGLWLNGDIIITLSETAVEQLQGVDAFEITFAQNVGNVADFGSDYLHGMDSRSTVTLYKGALSAEAQAKLAGAHFAIKGNNLVWVLPEPTTATLSLLALAALAARRRRK